MSFLSVYAVFILILTVIYETLSTSIKGFGPLERGVAVQPTKIIITNTHTIGKGKIKKLSTDTSSE